MTDGLDLSPLRALALCAGIGGLELGISRVLATRVVGWVERDPYAQRVLLARIQDGALDDAPLWDDLETFDAAPWRGRVDLVAAGFPCQPFSVAGAKRGADDERDLWDSVARVLHECRPSLVVLENVERLVRAPGGLDRVLGDLAALGFDAEWDVVTAAEAGAPHRRARVFVLAWSVSDSGRDRLRLAAKRGVLGEAERGNALAGDVGGGVADAAGERPGCGADSSAGEPEAPRSGGDVGDPDEQGRAGGAGAYEGRAEPADGREGVADPDDVGRGAARPARERSTDAEQLGAGVADAGRDGPLERRLEGGRGGLDREGGNLPGGLPLWPPGPDDREAWAVIARTRPDALPAVRRVADGDADGLDRDARGMVADRRPRLRCLGNAVVPAQAALGIEGLVRRALA